VQTRESSTKENKKGSDPEKSCGYLLAKKGIFGKKHETKESDWDAKKKKTWEKNFGKEGSVRRGAKRGENEQRSTLSKKKRDVGKNWGLQQRKRSGTIDVTKPGGHLYIKGGLSRKLHC